MGLDRRQFGILLPVFSLPGEGTLDGARTFVRFLQDTGAGIWQVLPLGPTHEDGSPYLALSANAGNPFLIGMRSLSDRVGGPVSTLAEAYAIVGERDRRSAAFNDFLARHGGWVHDYGLFTALRAHHGGVPWFEWPEPLRRRDDDALAEARRAFPAEIEFVIWQQFVFFSQWHAIKESCHAAGIALFGDVPIYVSHDSADVWQHQELFQLDGQGRATAVAGVPPDYFSPTGQRWGNPLYDWEALRRTGYDWWIERMSIQSELFDILRIDHFRGLESYWEIPGDSPTAETGTWRAGPGATFIEQLLARLPGVELVAEDLGTITAEVDALRRQFGLPGIRVLQFGFDGVWDNPHSLGNIEENMVLYTGTHDNDTSVGWYSSIPDWQKQLVNDALSHYNRTFPDSLLACAFESRANTVVLPVQDLLGLGSAARMNTPGTMVGNWSWRLPRDASLGRAGELLRSLKTAYDR
ncbi:MAG: 4-alpha-glucanotransferase [Pseudomonadales bacterium]|nr:4-alpha-glucanotransferase [Pseudomonadales bacterium]